MPDAFNVLSESEKLESQRRWDERMTSINAASVNATGENLKRVWLQGKLYDDMLRNSSAYGLRTLKEIAKEFNCSEDHLSWRLALGDQYNEADIDLFATSGLGWCDVFALLHFNELEEREDVRVRLAEKKITWQQALEEAGRSKRQTRAQLKKERAQAIDTANREKLKNDPASFVDEILQSVRSVFYVCGNMVSWPVNADARYRAKLETMTFEHRLKVLSHRQSCVELMRYFSVQVAEIACKVVAAVPSILVDHPTLEALPVLTDTAALWKDLHDWRPQFADQRKSKVANGFTVICKDLRELEFEAPRIVEKIASVEWCLSQRAALPEGEGREKCDKSLKETYGVMARLQDKLKAATVKLTA